MKRGYKQYKYHFCARCGDRCDLLTEMVWQGGILVCKAKCEDTGNFPLTGDRQAEVARLTALYTAQPELQPDRMLVEASIQQEDDISFNI